MLLVGTKPQMLLQMHTQMQQQQQQASLATTQQPPTAVLMRAQLGQQLQHNSTWAGLTVLQTAARFGRRCCGRAGRDSGGMSWRAWSSTR